MIQTIINNFQSIIEAKIKVEGVTLLIGESNQGKSACLRAIQAAFTNRFRGGMVRHGEEQALIRTKVPESSDILSVARMWDGGSPKMKLGNKIFTKLGRTLPKEIDEFLNLGFYDLNGELYSCNFHTQFQKPLLLEYSQRKVMELLSASSALDDLKLVKEQVLLDRQTNKGAIATVDSIIEESRTNLSKVSDSINTCQSKIEEFLSKVEELNNIKSKLEVVISFHKLVKLFCEYQVKDLITNTEIKLLKFNQVKDLHTQQSILLKKEGLYSKFRETYNQDLVEKVQALSKLKDLFESLVSLSYKEAKLVTKYDLFKKGSELNSKFYDLRIKHQIVSETKSQFSLFANILKREEELKRVVEENICPICGNKINNGLQ